MKISVAEICLLLYIKLTNACNGSSSSGHVIFDNENNGIEDIENIKIPDDAEEINFDQNFITRVPNNVFKDLPNIGAIRFQYNLIHIIEDESFVNAPSLQALSFHNNKLICISKFMFTGLLNLTYLDLSNNEIYLIENDSFGMMNHLDQLFLSHNELKSLSETIFAPPQVDTLIDLTLYENPIECDTRICWIIHWIEQSLPVILYP